MQATAVMEKVSDKGYHGDERNSQEDKASSPKKESPLCSSHSDESRLTFLGDDWASLDLEHSADVQDVSPNARLDGSEPWLTASPDTHPESTCSRPSKRGGGADCPFLNETYLVHRSEAKLKSAHLPHLSSELDSDLQKGEEMFFDVLEPQGNRTVDLDRTYQVSGKATTGTPENVHRYDPEEESQLEYHSAEEQCIRSHLSFDQAKTMDVSHLDVVRFRVSGCEVTRAGSPEDSRGRLGGSCSLSLDSLDACGQEASPHVSEFQSSVTRRAHPEATPGKCGEQETRLLDRTMLNEAVLRGGPLGDQESQAQCGFLTPPESLKAETDAGRLSTRVTESTAGRGHAAAESAVPEHLARRSTLPQEVACQPVGQRCAAGRTCWTSVFSGPAMPACGCSHCESLQSTPTPASDVPLSVPRAAVRDSQALDDHDSRRVARGHPLSKRCPQSVAGARSQPGPEAACHAVTVSQSVDVSGDFRACFTTSRASSARASGVSTASNTEITMMNKIRPGEWQREKCRSVACNTDWPCGQGARDAPAAGTQLPLGTARSADSRTSGGHALHQVSLDLRKTLDHVDLKKHLEGEFQLAREVERTRPPPCCERTLQRAIRAELQLLSIHYQTYHRHYRDIFRLLAADRGALDRNLPSNAAKKELESVVLSLLGDLKVRYLSLKEKINQGVPLEELPPLSVESKLLSIFSTFASRLIKGDSDIFSGADLGLDSQSTSDVDVSSSLKALSQVSLLSDGNQAQPSPPPEDEGLRTDDISVDLSQLKLDDKDGRSCRERSEAWFDAKETLTGEDSSGAHECLDEQSGGDPKSALEVKNAEPVQRERGHLVHVGGLCPSVSEADLKSHFQKYCVSEISVCDSSGYRSLRHLVISSVCCLFPFCDISSMCKDIRYASLAFRKSSDARVAVREMNGAEINGKSVNVRLVKTPGEHASPLSSRGGKQVGSEPLENSTCKASSAPGAPRARTRHLGSELDSEFFPSERKGRRKHCKQVESAKVLPDRPIQFIPSNTLNLRSFTKIMKRLTELHPEVSRDHIINTLQEVRKNHKGFLNGLSISSIVEMTSSSLKNSASS